MLASENLNSLAIPNTSIGHDSFTESTLNKLYSNSISQVCPSQVGSIQISSSQVSSSQISFSQIGHSQSSFSQISSIEISPLQIGLFQRGSAEIDISEIDSSKIMPRDIDSTEVSAAEVGSLQSITVKGSVTQVDVSKVNTNKFSIQINPTKISFPSSVALQQFFSSHNTSPTTIYDINNTAPTLWNTSLQSTTPLNLNVVIQDLPTGQLAEATITGFDPTGRPNSGTLYLDTDANGLGWYINPTPLDNSE